MAYPHRFHRIVIGGTVYAETWNTSFTYFPTTDRAADASILATVAAAVSAWFTNGTATGPSIVKSVKLASVKVNRIDTDGHYADGTSFTHIYPTPLAGGGATQEFAPQLSGVVSLRTAFDRGLANRGRMYIPGPGGYQTPGADGRVLVSSAVNLASSVASLFNNVRAGYGSWLGGGDPGGVAVHSNVGGGAWHLVTSVKAGRVIDTMRSRRSSLPEDYQTSTVAIAGV